MKIFSSPLAACGLLWLASITGIVPPAAAQVSGTTTPAGTQLLAQSAQLTVLANVNGEWLTLRIQRTSNQTPLVPKDVAVTVAGHPMPVKANADGTYVLPVKQLPTTNMPMLDIVVGHDGIREILSGPLKLPQGAAPVAGGQGHTQMLWWIVNIALVFGVAMYFSNRKKKPEAAE